MHDTLCICALIPRLETRTRLVLMIHRIEDRKTTNTGRLAAECLANSEVNVRGFVGQPTERFECAPDSQPILLFPHEEAVPITRFADSTRPITLVVPDGTWRQASKVRNRVPGLADVPCVSLPPDARTAYRLRHESHHDGLATLEAIARAFGLLEGSHIRIALERILRIMVERTLWSRGVLSADQVTGGLPADARRLFLG
jgi:DTW domain-containing protein YfiP